MIKKLCKVLPMLILAAMLISACGGGAPASTTAATTTAAPADAAETTAQAAETEAQATTAAAETEAATTEAAKSESAAPGASSDLPFVNLTFYMMGEQQNDEDVFYKTFDEWTLRDLNCKVNFKFANTWIDYAAKYNLMLAADDTIDMCYAANWIDFYSYAKKDAFEDISDMLPKYCPEIWREYPREQFNGATVNGKIYGVPQNWTNYHGTNFVYREDLRKKYNLPEMTLDYDVMEEYFKTVLENESFPFILTYQYTSPEVMFQAHMTEYDGIDATALAMMAKRGTRETMYYFDDPGYLDFAYRMKKWCDLGFWSKSILSTADSTDHGDLFREERIFVALTSHLDRFDGIAEDAAKLQPDWEIGFIPYATLSGVFYHTRTAQDLTVIPTGSKNPERSLMVLDKLITDKDYYVLTQYGTEGLNYEIDSDGYITYANIDTTVHNFNLNLWAMRNNDLALPVARFWDRKGKYEDVYFPKLVFDPYDGFAIDLTDVQAEHSALTQVIKEYAEPIHFGVVADPAAAVETLRQKMKEAGSDKFKAEIDRQLNEYLDSRG